MRDLSQQLIELGPRVSFPDPPDLAGVVLADPRLRQTRPPVRIHRAVAVALVAVLVVVLALPGPRAAIASLLGLGGTQRAGGWLAHATVELYRDRADPLARIDVARE